jgi:penicillin amidase
MKLIKFIISAALTILLVYAADRGSGTLPPIGHFMSPQTGFWQNDQSESPETKLNLSGLQSEVTVHYDSELIPHVFAQNDSDLYYAQGYITAKHRLWQMEFQTYAAAGRLSEIIGKKAIEYDRGQRRKGMVFGAQNAINEMLKDPILTKRLNAYSDGVNAYIESLDSEEYPVEYKLLGYAPEKWKPEKSALLLMYMTDMLAGRDEDLENTNFLSLFGRETFDLLFPDFIADQDPVIPRERDWTDFGAVERPESPEGVFKAIVQTTDVLDKPDPDNGSNNWAVNAEHSENGNPLLANDPHLGLNLPSIWYVMQLSAPDHNVMGATLPGALGVIIGFNDRIAWGVTNATRDVKDWYRIEFEDETKKRYRYGKGWRDIREVIETIKVKGGQAVLDTVRYTHYGPITYDETFKGNGRENLAMKWIGHLPNSNQNTFLSLNRAKNYEEYVKAVSTYTAPAQNFIFASKDNDIALWIQGKIANKFNEQGKFVLDGSNPYNEWQSFIPQEHNPHVRNPERGFVSSANQHPTDENYPYYVYDPTYETYRNRVINDFFRSKKTFSVQDFKDLHNNNYNLKAAEVLPTFLSMIASEVNSNTEGYFTTLSSWDYYNHTDAIGASVFEALWNEYYTMVWDELTESDLALQLPDSYQTIWLTKYHSNHEFFDLQSSSETEDAAAIARLAFNEAAKKLDAFKKSGKSLGWASYKGTQVGHLLQALPAFSRFEIPIGGNKSIVNATSKTHGPSWRMIVELDSETKALGVYPGGQSGNPGSRYYDSMIDTWAAGDYYELLYLPNSQAISGITSTTQLKP